MKILTVILSLLCTSEIIAQSSFERDLDELTERRTEDLSAASEPIDRRYQAALEDLLKKATRAGDVDAAIRIREAQEKFPGSAAIDPKSSFEKDLNQLVDRRNSDLVNAAEPIHRRHREELESLSQLAKRSGDIDAAIKITEALRNFPASYLIGKLHPRNAEELKEFMHGTTWNISNGSASAEVRYAITFDKNGTFKQKGGGSDGRTGKFQALSANTFKLWNYDPGKLNEDFNQYRAVGSAAVYFGRLKSD